MKYILALDQGTTSTRAIIFNKHGEIISKAQKEFKQIYPKAGWVEHSPRDIMGSIMAVFAESLALAELTAEDIAAVGITNQRETTIVWEKSSGKPVYNAIVWQCRRTAKECEKLIAKGYSDKIYEKCGLIPDAYFSATKIKWILDNVQGARERAEKGELLFGTVDTYIMWQLSKGRIFATDYTNAARTMLFNIHTLEWDDELLSLFDIPRCMLPEVHPSSYAYGEIDKAYSGVNLPICGVCGDQQAALFGQLCFDKGEVKNTYGTGCFLLMNTGDKPVKSKNGLITTLGAAVEDTPPYVLEGSVFIGGALVQWLRDGLKMISCADESEPLARKVKDNGGVYIVPAFTGLGAPYWNGEARGAILGLTRGATREHIVRAALEGIAYQVSDLVDAMEKDSTIEISRLTVDGGAAKNNFLLEFQSSILGKKVLRPKIVETTALGAAYLAGLNCGYWKDVAELKENVEEYETFTPAFDEAKRKKYLQGWQKAVRQTVAK